MTGFRRGFVLVATTIALLAPTSTRPVWALGGQQTVHGTNISIHPITDTNFCLESEGDGTVIVSPMASVCVSIG